MSSQGRIGRTRNRQMRTSKMPDGQLPRIRENGVEKREKGTRRNCTIQKCYARRKSKSRFRAKDTGVARDAESANVCFARLGVAGRVRWCGSSLRRLRRAAREISSEPPGVHTRARTEVVSPKRDDKTAAIDDSNQDMRVSNRTEVCKEGGKKETRAGEGIWDRGPFCRDSQKNVMEGWAFGIPGRRQPPGEDYTLPIQLLLQQLAPPRNELSSLLLSYTSPAVSDTTGN